MCATARSGLGLATQGQNAWSGHPPSPHTGPLWVWLENIKADPMQDIMCKRKKGRSFCRVSLGHSPADQGQRSEYTEVLWRRVSSQLREGGWLLSLSLGKVVGERGAENEGKDQRGASLSPSSR